MSASPARNLVIPVPHLPVVCRVCTGCKANYRLGAACSPVAWLGKQVHCGVCPAFLLDHRNYCGPCAVTEHSLSLHPKPRRWSEFHVPGLNPPQNMSLSPFPRRKGKMSTLACRTEMSAYVSFHSLIPPFINSSIHSSFTWVKEGATCHA